MPGKLLKTIYHSIRNGVNPPEHPVPECKLVRFLTPAQVVERYGGSVSVGTLANWRATGVSPPYVKLGGKVIYPEPELEKWERKRTATGTYQYRR